MRLGGRPADHRIGHVRRERLRELGPRLLAADDDDARPAEPAEPGLELLGDRPVVLVREVLDVPLEPGLRPAALVVPARRVLRPVGDRLQAAVPERQHASLLAADDGDERAVSAPEQRHERRQQEVVGDARRVGHRRRQREHAPDVVRPGREHREPVRAVPVELAVEELLEPLEVGLQPAAHLVGEVGPRRAVRLRRQVEQRMDPRRRVAGGRDAAWIEVEVEADRAAVLGPEGRQLAQTVEADHRCRHTRPFCLSRARF